MSSKKKKTYALLVILGFVALLGDRLLTSATTPAPAAASSGAVTSPATRGGSDGASRPTDSNPGAGAGGPAGSVTTATFPRNLPAAPPTPDTDAPLRDVFGLTPEAYQALGGPAADAAAQAGGARSGSFGPHGMTAAQFTEDHRLTAVMQGPEIAIAVVDHQWVQPGQSIDGCTLVEITGRTASFRCSDALAELTVETHGLESAGSKQPTAR